MLHFPFDFYAFFKIALSKYFFEIPHIKCPYYLTDNTETKINPTKFPKTSHLSVIALGSVNSKKKYCQEILYFLDYKLYLFLIIWNMLRLI